MSALAAFLTTSPSHAQYGLDLTAPASLRGGLESRVGMGR